jgi:hypothetical protein
MSSLLFLLDVIAFLVVVQWACANEAPGATGLKGLLGMHDKASDAAAQAERAAPAWRKRGDAAVAPATTARTRWSAGPQPGWRRTLR